MRVPNEIRCISEDFQCDARGSYSDWSVEFKALTAQVVDKAYKGMPADLDCKLFGFPEPKWEWFDLGINTGSKLTIGDPKDGKPLKTCDNKKVQFLIIIIESFTLNGNL